MQSITQYALVASIFASVLGALVMCVLVFRYGFTVPAPTDADGGSTPTDVLVTRVGHAVAGACFAATAVLAIVGLALRSPQGSTTARQPVAPLPTAVVTTTVEPPRDDASSRLPDEVDALQRRLAKAEAQLARMNGEVAAKSARAVPSPFPGAPARRSEARAPAAVSVAAAPAPRPAPEPPRPAPAVSAAATPNPPVPMTVVSTPAPATPPATAPVAPVPSSSSSASIVPEEPAPSASAVSASRGSTPARSQEPLATARDGRPTTTDRVNDFMHDVRAALTRVERTVIRHLGDDPQGRVSARD